jgi:hypothetical protein
MSFTIMSTFLEVKEVMFLQRLNRFAYEKGIPRALFVSPIIF